MHVRGTLRTDGRVRREAGALVQAGFAVTVVDVESAGEGGFFEEEMDGVRARHLVKPRWFTPTAMPWRLVKSLEKFLVCVLAVCRTSADIYHAHDVNALPACFLAALLRGKTLVFDAHELPLYELERTRWHLLRGLLTRLLTVILRRCAAIITVSEPIAQEIRVRYHVTGVSVLRNVPAYQPARESQRLRQRLELGPEVRLALYQGNLQPDRGLDHLIRAARFLEPGCVLVLMGKAIGETLAQLNALIAQEGVGERVRLLPAVPYAELLDWTASADLGLIIYTPELSLNIQMCLPNKLFEYLMAGLPVLATPLVAVAEVLQTHEAGQIVPSLEPTEVAAAINTLLANSSRLEQMHRNALHAAQSELHWEKETLRLVSLYQRIEKSNVGRRGR